MNITPIGNYDKNNNVAFSAKINGITLPKKTADTINKLSSACTEVIGRETHLLKTPVGSTNATYSKWSKSFKVDVGDKSTLTVIKINSTVFMLRILMIKAEWLSPFIYITDVKLPQILFHV